MSSKNTKSKIKNCRSGQSLIEVIIALAIGSFFIGAAVAVIVVALRISSQTEFSQKATELNQELSEQVNIVAKDSWHNLNSLVLGSSTEYHLSENGSFLSVNTGTEPVTIDETAYTRWFSIESVQRDSNSQIVDSGGTIDPSTFKITFYTEWTQNADTAQINMTSYVARKGNEITIQNDWVDGPGTDGPITELLSQFSTSTNIHYASSGQITLSDFQGAGASSTGNIDSTNKWAWNDVIGWIDMNHYQNVTVSSSIIQGYASSSIDEIVFDCATSPSTNCDYSYSISNDGAGVLNGWAWNENIGWISVNCSDLGVCGVSNYAVNIDPNTGDFSGWAWNDIVGWISFNCSNTGSCSTVDYKVTTRWGHSIIDGTLISSIVDTQIPGGVALNTVMWQGSQPSGTAVKFQIASSDNGSGPWSYIGPDGTSGSYYQPAGPDIQSKIIRSDHNNKRYLRYKVFLESNTAKTAGPTVNSIVISWSP